MSKSSKSARLAVPTAPIHSVDPHERMNRIGFYFFMGMVTIGVLVAFGALLFI